MEVKEAIEFLKNEIKTHKEILETFGIPEMLKEKADVKNAITIYQDIITLLQQGEKHRQQDLKTIQFYIKYYNMWNVLKANTEKETIDYMYKLEQKHFPKEVKQDEANTK